MTDRIFPIGDYGIETPAEAIGRLKEWAKAARDNPPPSGPFLADDLDLCISILEPCLERTVTADVERPQGKRRNCEGPAIAARPRRTALANQQEEGMNETIEREPDHLERADFDYSNSDHEMPPKAEEGLKEGKHYMEHTAWDHYGVVWFDVGRFHERVMRYGVTVATVSGDTLRDVIDEVNHRFGSA